MSFSLSRLKLGKLAAALKLRRSFIFVCVSVCVLILSWYSFSCHLFGFSANNEIIMRSLMGIKKKKEKTPHMNYPVSPSPSLCLSVKSILHNRSLSLDLRQNWRRPGVGSAPIVLLGTRIQTSVGQGMLPFPPPPSPVPPWTLSPPSSNRSSPPTPTLGGEGVKASIGCFRRLNVWFIWGVHTPFPLFNFKHSWLGLVQRDQASV